jgi:protein deglycase
LLFVYDRFAEFEIAILMTGFAQSEYETVTLSIEGKRGAVKSVGGLNVLADLSVNDINTQEFEALIIPGGSPYPLFNNDKLKEIIREFYNQNKLVAAICGGPGLLAAAGILDEVTYSSSLEPSDEEYKDVMNWDNKTADFLTIDKNVVTATGSNYLDFAEEVLRYMNVIKEDEIDPLNYFRVPSAT